MNIHNRTIHVREGRITPKYKGYFVSFWKKVDNINTPYDIDEVEQLIVQTPSGDIYIPKSYLIKNKILSSENNKGKLGFRIKEDDDILKAHIL